VLPRAEAGGPLDGVRVLDLTTVVLGPYATQILGDMGAEVIKVESPEGDIMRANGVSRHPGMSSIFLALNRNKRSIALDLKRAEGRRAFLDLAARADIVVHNMRLAAIERLGLGYEAVRAVNPGVIYCAATGFAQDGPYHGKPAFDDIVQAASGLAALMPGPDGAPTYVPALVADKTAGMAVVNAALAALVRRHRTGQGGYVEIPMFETMVGFNMAEHMGGLAFEPPLGPPGYARIVGGGRRPVRTADGHVAILPYGPPHWIRLLRRLGRDDLLAAYDLSDRHKLNATVRDLYAELGAMGPDRSTAAWVSLCEGLDIPVTPVLRMEELTAHPQLAAIGLFEVSEHPTEGPVRQVRPAARFDGAAPAIRRHAPGLGEHGDAILREIGRSPGQIEALRASGILAGGAAGN